MRSGLPVIAEDPLSFDNAISHAALFLSDRDIREYFKPDAVLVIGRTTLSRSINAFIDSAPQSIIMDPRMANVDTLRHGDRVIYELAEIVVDKKDSTWNEAWNSAAKASEGALIEDWSERTFLRELTRLLPDNSAIFIGSSRPARDIEACAIPRAGLHVFANRGLAGIDGNISTAFGIATKFAQTFSIVGDLTFLHDLSALASTNNDQHTIFIIDNNGGGIFSTLPQAGVAGFEKIFGTPHNQDLGKILTGFNVAYEVIKNESDLERAVVHNVKGLKFYLVEVPTRDEMAKLLKEIYANASKAVRIGLNLA